MNGSLRLGSLFGITVRVHVLLLILLALMLFSSPGQGLSGLLSTATLFGVVLLHELGHSLVAQSFGIHVLDITLWPLGGMARMSEIPESSRIEGLVAVAGPVVNFVLAALSAVALWIASGGGVPHVGIEGFFGPFLGINLAMGIFNLIPAFPTDGGRILRAFLGRKGDWVAATEQAVRIGRVFAILIAVSALPIAFLSLAQGLILVMIAAFLWFTGAQELMAVRLRHAARPFDAFQSFARKGSAQGPADWSSRAAGGSFASDASATRGTQGAPGARAAPAHDAGEAGDDARPESQDEAHGLRGFSQDEIERLERFRGRLRSYRPDET